MAWKPIFSKEPPGLFEKEGELVVYDTYTIFGVPEKVSVPVVLYGE